MLKSSRHTVLTSVYSILHWLSHALVIYCLMLALDIDLSPLAALVVLTVNALLLMFPITPGNLGTFQWACVVSMTTLFGVPKESSISFSVLLHLLDMAPIYIAGFLFITIDRMQFKDIRKVVEEEEEECVELLEGKRRSVEVDRSASEEEPSVVQSSSSDDDPP